MKIFFFAFIIALIVAMIVSIDIPGNFELKLLGSILKVFPISCVLTYMCMTEHGFKIFLMFYRNIFLELSFIKFVRN